MDTPPTIKQETSQVARLGYRQAMLPSVVVMWKALASCPRAPPPPSLLGTASSCPARPEDQGRDPAPAGAAPMPPVYRKPRLNAP
eukprot:scaffold1023_cov313-Pinguiococcus_pyrenoidosus.AAC.32